MTIIYDDFNRADASSLGANWTTVDGGGSQLGIVSNECLQTAVGSPAKEYWNANSFSGAIYAQCKISTLPSAEWSAAPALFNPTLSQEYVVLAKPDTILVRRNGVQIIDGGTTLSAGDIIRLEFEAGTVTLKKNGAVIGTPYVDGSPYSPNRIGLHCYYNDSVPSSWAVDDFEGGDLEAAGETITLTPDPASVQVGGTRTFTATRSAPAGAGGVTYNLTSSDTGKATVPATATILEGNSSITFNATGVAAGSTTITATNAADSGETDSVTLTVTALTKKLKLLAHADAQGDSGVAGAVWSAPAGSNITGPTKYGEFTGATFEAALEGGKAVLKVPVADFGGSALTTSDTPVALVRNATNTTGIISCTVIEE